MGSSYSLLEWNLHKMTRNVPVQRYVVDRIVRDRPDLLVLVEYKRDDGIERALQDDYFYDVAIGAGGNDVLVAVKRETVRAGTRVAFDPGFLQAELGEDQPTILAASFTTREHGPLTVIGLRYVQGGNGLRVSGYLKRRLDALANAFVCTGDFNVLACRMPVHFKEYYHESYDGGKDGASVVMLNDFKQCAVTGYNRLDHVIYSAELQAVGLNYTWDFTSLSKAYIPYDRLALGDIWNIPVAHPDHAVLECELKLN